ncbi:YkgJ family cysteine cluster protein [uncultured Desulfuromonas sp.]|uniref:YkgJ family cysteine cluster protein n=1 Tax=uncultured Desulfuromonas sp. TaxID=181013 RepID=UPI002AAB7772|nr:YkgJ family cysteine cluster protein [uncultured Desulfuromonas sp.]
MGESEQINGAADRGQELLAIHAKNAHKRLSDFLDQYGTGLEVLGKAIGSFTQAVYDLPESAACAPGCAWCCHLRVETSIPELLVIYRELMAGSTPEGIDSLKKWTKEAASVGDLLDEDLWYQHKLPCPFLDNNKACLIYSVRPFACRAHHSMDAKLCQKGYEEGRRLMIPSLPLYKASTDIYATIFIKVMADRGFASFPVGFIKGLAMLLEEPALAAAWLDGEDVFSPARIMKRVNR